MTSGFRRTRRGVEVRLSRREAAVLRSLVEFVLSLLASEGEAPPADPLEALVGLSERQPGRPTDPALARLLPDAYADDEEAAAEFRRFTESGLRAAKRSGARTVLATLPADGGRAELDPAAAEAWLGALNDVRLALGARLDVGEAVHEQIAGLPADDPRLPELLTYEWLGFLEETLVEALAA